jgi:hypothetical protein
MMNLFSQRLPHLIRMARSLKRVIVTTGCTLREFSFAPAAMIRALNAAHLSTELRMYYIANSYWLRVVIPT